MYTSTHRQTYGHRYTDTDTHTHILCFLDELVGIIPVSKQIGLTHIKHPIILYSTPYSHIPYVRTHIMYVYKDSSPDVLVLEHARIEVVNLSCDIQNVPNTTYE